MSYLWPVVGFLYGTVLSGLGAGVEGPRSAGAGVVWRHGDADLNVKTMICTKFKTKRVYFRREH